MECPGIVTNVTNFGAFVDVGLHHDGLVHVSQLGIGSGKDPRPGVKPGDHVKVRVLAVDLEKGQFSLTMRAPEDAARPRPRPGNRRGRGERPRPATTGGESAPAGPGGRGRQQRRKARRGGVPPRPGRGAAATAPASGAAAEEGAASAEATGPARAGARQATLRPETARPPTPRPAAARPAFNNPFAALGQLGLAPKGERKSNGNGNG
jgi:uncharacterized protein